MRLGFVSGSYTARSTAIADEECINWFAESVESQGAVVPSKVYGGQAAKTVAGLLGTPGLSVFTTLPQSPTRGSCEANGRLFVVAGTQFIEVSSIGAQTAWGNVGNDGTPASLVFNSLQILIVSAGRAFCFTLATNVIVEVTGDLAGVPVLADYSDTYFIVMFQDNNKFQLSQVLDGTTWPGQLVNEVSVFADNISSIRCNHRELWVLGQLRSQPYQDTGSTEAFDPIPGTMLEMGCAATFCTSRVDNSVFWIGADERGSLVAWRSSGYTPVRISTYAVELDLSKYSTDQIAGIVSYAYQDAGHLWWTLYIPGSNWSWVYDVVEGLWHKRCSWNPKTATFGPHFSWNYVRAFGKHLVGDWNSGNLYEISMDNLTDNGANILRVRRTPTVINEKERVYHAEITVDFAAGNGPQPPLIDGNGQPRQPQAMQRWSDDQGNNWSNQHTAGTGMAGAYGTRVIFRRLGQSRQRVYELSVSDPVRWAIVDAYLRTA